MWVGIHRNPVELVRTLRSLRRQVSEMEPGRRCPPAHARGNPVGLLFKCLIISVHQVHAFLI